MKTKDKIYDIMSRILSFYEKIGEISMHKLLFLVYLSDWKNSIDHGKQLTGIRWKYIDEEFSRTLIAALEKATMEPGKLYFDKSYACLKAEEIKSIDFITHLSIELDTDDFLKLVYSTFPMLQGNTDTYLDLPHLAKDYKENYSYVG